MTTESPATAAAHGGVERAVTVMLDTPIGYCLPGEDSAWPPTTPHRAHVYDCRCALCSKHEYAVPAIAQALADAGLLADPADADVLARLRERYDAIVGCGETSWAAPLLNWIMHGNDAEAWE